MMRKSFLSSVLALAFVLLVPNFSTAAAAPAINFTSAPGSSSLDLSVGWAFSISNPLLISGLGYYDLGQDGLASDHNVGIFDFTQTLLVSAVVPSGTAGDLIDGFRYTSIPAFVLNPGSYFLVAANPGGADPFVAQVSGFSVDPRISYFTGAFSFDGDTLSYPTNVSTALDPSLFGPDMLISSVPEPSTLMLLLVSSLAGLGIVVGRRNYSGI